MLPSSAMTWSRDTASLLPTMSLMRLGRYFSTCAHVARLAPFNSCAEAAAFLPAAAPSGHSVLPPIHCISSLRLTQGRRLEGLDVEGAAARSTSISVALIAPVAESRSDTRRSVFF